MAIAKNYEQIKITCSNPEAKLIVEHIKAKIVQEKNENKSATTFITGNNETLEINRTLSELTKEIQELQLNRMNSETVQSQNMKAQIEELKGQIEELKKGSPHHMTEEKQYNVTNPNGTVNITPHWTENRPSTLNTNGQFNEIHQARPINPRNTYSNFNNNATRNNAGSANHNNYNTYSYNNNNGYDNRHRPQRYAQSNFGPRNQPNLNTYGPQK